MTEAKLRLSELLAQAEKIESEKKDANDSDTRASINAQIQQVRRSIDELTAKIPSCGPVRYAQLSDFEKTLHRAAFVVNAGDPAYHTLQPLPFEDQRKPQTMMVPKGDILSQFRRDVNEGRLPTVSWLTAPEKFSDHPTSPWYGAWYVSEVMDILTKNPDVWRKTIFILTYDENDGYFDHAPSYVAADPKRPETGGASSGIETALEYTYREDEVVQGVNKREARSGPIGMGFRVPMIIASPWTRGGWVNSQLFDHTSTLMFLEHFVQRKYGKSAREENISTWRRAISGNLTSVFRPFDANDSKLAYINRDEFVVSIEKTRYKEIPANYGALTCAQIAEINRDPSRSKLTAHQEQGTRPACPLPYELYADGCLSPDGMNFELNMTAGNRVHGERSAGAPFNVYLRNLRPDARQGNRLSVATYTVKVGDTLHRQIPLSIFADSKYVIEIHGPNGFYRWFSGTSELHAIQVRAAYELPGAELTGNMRVILRNSGDRQVSCAIVDNSYKTDSVSRAINPGEEASIILESSRNHGWYDFTVSQHDLTAEARFAGRVETGKPTVSDPLMGGRI